MHQGKQSATFLAQNIARSVEIFAMVFAPKSFVSTLRVAPEVSTSVLKILAGVHITRVYV
jgi:hypothetical protein